MPAVQFTKKVNELFGGVYVTPQYTAKAGTIVKVSPTEKARLHATFPGLIVDRRGAPMEGDEPEVVSDGEGAEAASDDGEEAAEEDEEAEGPLKGKAEDRRLRKGRRKKR